jgi:hypothetical protein
MECSICFEVSDFKLICGHFIHLDCIENVHKLECPMCRAELTNLPQNVIDKINENARVYRAALIEEERRAIFQQLIIEESQSPLEILSNIFGSNHIDISSLFYNTSGPAVMFELFSDIYQSFPNHVVNISIDNLPQNINRAEFTSQVIDMIRNNIGNGHHYEIEIDEDGEYDEYDEYEDNESIPDLIENRESDNDID